MKKIFLLLLIFCSFFYVCAKFEYTFEGYVKLTGPVYDSRQIIAERDGISIDTPAPFVPDCRCRDKNAHPIFSMSAIETNTYLSISGPKVYCADSKAVIAAEFFGPTDQTVDTFYMIHSYLTIDTPEYQWLFGQYWHHTFVADCYPGIIGYDNGSPIEVQLRNPQIRFTRRWKKGEIFFAASSQVNYLSPGPLGDNSIYLRNAIMPDIGLQWRTTAFDNYLVGLGLEAKRLVPRLINDFNCIVHESVTSAMLIAYAKRSYERGYISSKILFGGNGADLGMINGYAIATKNAADQRTYAPIQVFSWWFDGEYQKRDLKIGLFTGFSLNLGAFKKLFIDPTICQPIVYISQPLLPNTDYVMRISPRITWKHAAIQYSFEFSVIRSGFGPLNDHGNVSHPKSVTDYRCMFAAYYYF